MDKQMSAKQFVEYMKANAPANRGLYIMNDFMCRYNSIVVSFWNMPKDDVVANRQSMNAAVSENNRFSYIVEGFDVNNTTIEASRVKLTMNVCAYGKEYRLRGKTGSPKDIADYLLGHFAKIMQVEPKL